MGATRYVIFYNQRRHPKCVSLSSLRVAAPSAHRHASMRRCVRCPPGATVTACRRHTAKQKGPRASHTGNRKMTGSEAKKNSNTHPFTSLNQMHNMMHTRATIMYLTKKREHSPGSRNRIKLIYVICIFATGGVAEPFAARHSAAGLSPGASHCADAAPPKATRLPSWVAAGSARAGSQHTIPVVVTSHGHGANDGVLQAVEAAVLGGAAVECARRRRRAEQLVG